MSPSKDDDEDEEESGEDEISVEPESPESVEENEKRSL